MSKLKILPGAAGIIALTATIGFIDGQREIEHRDLLRNIISLAVSQAYFPPPAIPTEQIPAGETQSPVYQVNLKRGDTSAAVLVDAVTGRLVDPARHDFIPAQNPA